MSDTKTPPLATPRGQEPRFWGSFFTSVFLASILSVGPLLLGGFRLWIMLPLLGAVGALVLFQGVRLLYRGPSLAGRFGDGVDVSVVLFLLYAAFRYVTASAEFIARIEVLHIYAYAAVFWIARYGFSRRKHVLYLLGALVVVGLIVAFSGFLFRFRPELRPYAPELLKHYAPRFCGTYGCPNHFGELVVMTLGILIGFCLFYRIRWTPRIIAFYLAGMMIVAVGLSLSRGSWLALVTSLMVMAFFLVRHDKLRWHWVAAGLVLAIGAAVAFYATSTTAQQRIEEIAYYKQNGNWDAYVRIELARDALKIANDHPWLGTGPATFRYVHPRYQSSTYSSLAEYTHNDYLNLLADYGVVGVLLVLLFIVLVTRQLFRHLGPLPDSDESLILVSALCAWCAMLVHATVDFNLHIPANAYVFFTLIGLGLRRSAAQVELTLGYLPRAPLARPLGVLVLLGGGVLVAGAWYTSRGYFAHHLANRDYGTRPFPAAFVAGKKAVEADPQSPLALRYLGDLYRNRAAAEVDFAKRTVDAQQAAALYQRAVQANPVDDELLALQGLSYDLAGRYSEAYLIHATVIKRQPYNGYFRLLLGLHFWRRNMLEEAQKVFEVGAKCPHGNVDNAKALNEINRILGERKVQEQLPVPEHAPTMP